MMNPPKFPFIGLVAASLAMADTALAGDPSPASGTLIVLNKFDGTATLLSRSDGCEIATLPTDQGPHEVAVSPDGQTAVVGNYGQHEPGHTLTVIDVDKRRVAKTIDLKEFHRPHGIVFLPDGNRVLVTAEVEKKLVVVDVDAGTITAPIDTGQDISHMLALAPTLGRAFVANIGSGSVTVVDLNFSQTVATISTGSGAEGIDVSPDGEEVWVTNRAADTISIIDTGSLEVVNEIACASFPIRLKFTPDGRHTLVSNARSGDVAVFDVRRRAEVRRIAMDASALEGTERRLFGDSFGRSPVPVGILIPPDGRHAYVANTNADIITVIDLATWQISGRLTAGREPDGLGYSPID